VASYLIYIPRAEIADAATLREAGLGEIVRDGQPVSRPIEKGPDGGPGAICYWPSPEWAQEYDPDRQRWEAAKPDAERKLPAGRCWFGVDRQYPPRPSEIARTRRVQIKAVPVRLSDGNEWLVPRARNLPSRVKIDEADGFLRENEAAMPEHVAAAQRIVGWLTADSGDPEIPILDGWQIAVRFLGINYRLERNLVAFLGLLEEEAIRDVCCAIADFESIRQEIARQYLHVLSNQSQEDPP
jgi:hypothetical protein